MVQTEIARLKRVIAHRQKFLEQITVFVPKLLKARGKQIHYEVHDAHTSWKAELKDLNGFSFKISTGHTMFGGNDLQISYSPMLKLAGADPQVFDVYWQILNEFEVRAFNPDPGWQIALRKLMRNRSFLKPKPCKFSKSDVQEVVQDQFARDELVRLRKQAETLGIHPMVPIT